MSTSRLPDMVRRVIARGLFAMTCLLMITGGVVGPNGHSLHAQDASGDAVTRSTLIVDPDASALGLTAPGSSWVTPDRTPEITGTGKPGTTIEVQVDDQVLGYADVTEDGTWRMTPESALTSGAHEVKIAVGARPKDPSVRPGVRVGEGEPSSLLDKGLSCFGIFFLIGVAVLMSNNRRAINWRLVSVGVGLQLVFAVVIFYFPFGKELFAFATTVIKKLLDFSGDGASFLFRSFVTGQWEPGLINITFTILPTIIFFSSLMTILYHIGVMQPIVGVFAKLMQRTMNISGAESLSAAANIFVGQTEAPLVIRPYIDEMTKSELMTVMTGGFATVAGGVLAVYVGLLEPVFPDIAGHLLAASVMSAPAALVLGKIIYPETEEPVTSGELNSSHDREDANVLDAASRGASEGLQLAFHVGAILLAFIALISLANYIIALPSVLYNSGVLRDLADLYTQKDMALP
ncbi:MAG: nucleoside transporter C-terminal domain-containing protein, partial [Myxococcota bacterium]